MFVLFVVAVFATRCSSELVDELRKYQINVIRPKTIYIQDYIHFSRFRYLLPERQSPGGVFQEESDQCWTDVCAWLQTAEPPLAKSDDAQRVGGVAKVPRTADQCGRFQHL